MELCQIQQEDIQKPEETKEELITKQKHQQQVFVRNAEQLSCRIMHVLNADTTMVVKWFPDFGIYDCCNN